MHMCVLEMSVHPWRKGTPFASMMDKGGARHCGNDPKSAPGWTILMTSIPFLPQWERGFWTNRFDATGRRLLMQSKQNFVSWMMDIREKFTKGSDVVVNGSDRTIYVAKKCLLMQQRRMFAGCDWTQLRSRDGATTIVNSSATSTPPGLDDKNKERGGSLDS